MQDEPESLLLPPQCRKALDPAAYGFDDQYLTNQVHDWTGILNQWKRRNSTALPEEDSDYGHVDAMVKFWMFCIQHYVALPMPELIASTWSDIGPYPEGDDRGEKLAWCEKVIARPIADGNGPNQKAWESFCILTRIWSNLQAIELTLHSSLSHRKEAFCHASLSSYVAQFADRCAVHSLGAPLTRAMFTLAVTEDGDEINWCNILVRSVETCEAAHKSVLCCIHSTSNRGLNKMATCLRNMINARKRVTGSEYERRNAFAVVCVAVEREKRLRRSENVCNFKLEHQTDLLVYALTNPCLVKLSIPSTNSKDGDMFCQAVNGLPMMLAGRHALAELQGNHWMQPLFVFLVKYWKVLKSIVALQGQTEGYERGEFTSAYDILHHALKYGALKPHEVVRLADCEGEDLRACITEADEANQTDQLLYKFAEYYDSACRQENQMSRLFSADLWHIVLGQEAKHTSTFEEMIQAYRDVFGPSHHATEENILDEIVSCTGVHVPIASALEMGHFEEPECESGFFVHQTHKDCQLMLYSWALLNAENPRSSRRRKDELAAESQELTELTEIVQRLVDDGLLRRHCTASNHSGGEDAANEEEKQTDVIPSKPRRRHRRNKMKKKHARERGEPENARVGKDERRNQDTGEYYADHPEKSSPEKSSPEKSSPEKSSPEKPDRTESTMPGGSTMKDRPSVRVEAEQECVLCFMENARTHIIVPCMHLCLCESCAIACEGLEECVICRTPVSGIYAVKSP